MTRRKLSKQAARASAAMLVAPMINRGCYRLFAYSPSTYSARAASRFWSLAWPMEAGASLASGFGLAMIGVLWAYEGWQYVTFSAGETVNAQRNFPRALLIGSSALIGIYLLANLGYIAALGPINAAQTDSIAAAAVTAVAGPGASKLVALAILISIFSAVNGIALTAPRVYYAMARDGLFFHRLSEVHPRFPTPAFAVLAGSAWAAVLAATGTFEQLLTYVVFSGWLSTHLARRPFLSTAGDALKLQARIAYQDTRGRRCCSSLRPPPSLSIRW